MIRGSDPAMPFLVDHVSRSCPTRQPQQAEIPPEMNRRRYATVVCLPDRQRSDKTSFPPHQNSAQVAVAVSKSFEKTDRPITNRIE